MAAGAASILTDNPTWIIDPIDGTTNFVHRWGRNGFKILPKKFRKPCRSEGMVISKFGSSVTALY